MMPWRIWCSVLGGMTADARVFETETECAEAAAEMRPRCGWLPRECDDYGRLLMPVDSQGRRRMFSEATRDMRRMVFDLATGRFVEPNTPPTVEVDDLPLFAPTEKP